MRKNKPSYQIEFSVVDKITWKAIKFCLGVISTYLSKRLKPESSPFAPDLLIVNILMRLCLSKPGSQFADEHKTYRKAILGTAYWHGSGRLQYKDGVVHDVLNQILQLKSLKPAKDIFEPKAGEMISLSLTSQRMYARIYGDMHEYEGAPKGSRYGSPRFWAYYFIMASVLRLIKEFKVWNPKSYKAHRKTLRTGAVTYWSIKVAKNPTISAGYFFNGGSDIPGNFPILFGIKRADFSEAEISKGVGLYEKRVMSNIPLSAVTHLEVPGKYRFEVETLLKQYNLEKLPVFSLEAGEYFWSRQWFTDLVKPKYSAGAQEAVRET